MNKRNILFIMIVLLIGGLVGCKSTENENVLEFDSMDELKEYYFSVDLFEFKEINFAFCELSEDQIIEGESGSW